MEIFSHNCDETALRCGSGNEADIDPLPGRLATDDSLMLYIPAVQIGQVCRSWNQLVKTCTSLWACFDVEIFRESSVDESAKLVDGVKHILNAAGSHGLKIGIDQSSIGLDGAFHPAVRMLIAESTRWVHLNLWLPNPDLLYHDQLRVLEGKLPLLGSLLIETSEEIPRETRTFAVAPLLRFAEINSSNVVLPWKQLRSLTSFNGRLHNTLRCLELSDQLHTLEIVNDFAPEWLPIPAVSSNIIDFDLQFSPPELTGVEMMLSVTSFPVLQCLRLEMELELEEEAIFVRAISMSPLLKFLQRCSSTLTNLTLNNMFLSGDEFIRVLKHTPQIDMLSVLEYRTQPFFTVQVSRHFLETPAILPQLKCLNVDLEFGNGLNFLHLADVVEHRHPRALVSSTGGHAISALQSVDFMIRDLTFSPDHLDKWKSLSHGLSVTLKDFTRLIDVREGEKISNSALEISSP